MTKTPCSSRDGRGGPGTEARAQERQAGVRTSSRGQRSQQRGDGAEAGICASSRGQKSQQRGDGADCPNTGAEATRRLVFSATQRSLCHRGRLSTHNGAFGTGVRSCPPGAPSTGQPGTPGAQPGLVRRRRLSGQHNQDPPRGGKAILLRWPGAGDPGHPTARRMPRRQPHPGPGLGSPLSWGLKVPSPESCCANETQMLGFDGRMAAPSRAEAPPPIDRAAPGS